MSSLIGKVLGKYRIVEKLGSGGMADVYKGIQIGLDREVAIKVLPPAFATDREMVKRFRRESQATAKLSHPNIITIYDSGEQEGLYFYVMEFLKNDSLADVLEREKPLPLPRATKIGQDILKALVYCHEKEILHRDLKPANIKFDMRENAILTDFGLVKDLGETAITHHGVALGTPQYMSPEAIRGLEVDARSDLYQVGAILYEMLTGRTPVEGATPEKLLGQRIPPPRELVPDLPEDLSQMLVRALKEDRDARFPTAKDMLAELKKVELKLKAKKFSTKQTQAVRSGAVSQPATTSAIASSELSHAGSAAGSGSGLASSLSAILSTPKDRESLFRLLALTVPVFLIGLCAVLWIFRPKEPPVVIEKVIDPEATRATISWKLDRPSYAQVEFWPTSSTQQKQRTKKLPAASVEHRHVLPELKADTAYNFRFIFSYAPEEDGPAFATEAFDFTTRADIQIFNIHVDEYAEKAVVTWETNLRTDTTVKFGKTEAHEDSRTNTEQHAETIHSITLEGLTPDTTYHYQLCASDARGRSAVKATEDLQFRTAHDAGPETGKNPDGLTNLVRSYVDKLTRMTPDEREKLKTSITKFTDLKSELTAADKKVLLEAKTSPKRDDDFNNRLQLARCWATRLRERKKPVKDWDRRLRLIQTEFYTNALKGSAKLDQFLKECSEQDN